LGFLALRASLKFAAVSEPDLLESKSEKMVEASLDVPPLAVTKPDSSLSETVPSWFVSITLTKSLAMLSEELDDEEDDDEDHEPSDGGCPSNPLTPSCPPKGGGGGMALASSSFVIPEVPLAVLDALLEELLDEVKAL
jgi:hypothetical protein